MGHRPPPKRKSQDKRPPKDLVKHYQHIKWLDARLKGVELNIKYWQSLDSLYRASISKSHPNYEEEVLAMRDYEHKASIVRNEHLIMDLTSQIESYIKEHNLPELHVILAMRGI